MRLFKIFKLSGLFLILFYLSLSSCSNSTKKGDATFSSSSQVNADKDYTLEIQAKPGMIIQGSIIGGRTNSGKMIGDYESTYLFTKVEGESFTFQWAFTYPASMRGMRTVDANDRRSSHRFSLYYYDGERGVRKGYSSLVLSTEVYQQLKAGVKIDFFTDGAEKSKTIEKIGEDKVELLLNETKVSLKVIKAQTDNGMTFFILDNPNLPLYLGRETSLTQSRITSISYLDIFAKQLIENLKDKKEITTRAIYFSFNAPVLQDESRFILEELGNFLKNNPKENLTIEVHTDNAGGSPFNLDLSQRRAENIKTYLLAKFSIPSSQIEARGFGDMKPIMENATYMGRAMNRRVVFRIK